MGRQKWTPGSWKANKGVYNYLDESKRDAWGCIQDDEDFVIATVWSDVPRLKAQSGANADLIASAPDLYEALENLLCRLQGELHDPEALWEVRAAYVALAKAKGGE